MASQIAQIATATGRHKGWLMHVGRLLGWHRRETRRLRPGDLSEYLLRDIGWSDGRGR